MITDKDVQKILSSFLPFFANKQELKELEIRLEEKFVTNERFDQAMNKLDFIVGELKTIRMEQAAHQFQHDDIEKEFDLIKSLPSIAHQIKR